MSNPRKAAREAEVSEGSAFDAAQMLAPIIASRAAQHDRDASFGFENSDSLAHAGLLGLMVPKALGI